MLKIRREQLGVLRGDDLRELEDAIVQTIASDYPARYGELGEEGTRELARHAIACGEAHRIVGQGAVTALAVLMVQYGEGFERSPDRAWALGLLEHPTLPQSLKLDLLLQRMAGRSQGRIIVQQGNE
jgi:hypothetical protein